MRFVRKEEEGLVEMKSYRLSFVRAALMVTAARQEAQLQVCFLGFNAKFNQVTLDSS
jgi:hypothetical protein